MTTSFAPGDLVFARGREWVALPSLDGEALCLRPLSGAEGDIQVLHPALERDPIRPAQFDLPDVADGIAYATRDAALLLSDALRLSLRRGAGPFRSAARVAFEPRAYQLVPLLMALRLPVVRLLIADDVGIGKTIEAGLVVRELIDRGEVDRFAVLCPPHLVEQWTGELLGKFDLDAVAVTASSAARLERGLPPSQTLFDAHPYTVVSLDYIKADKRRETFARVCPGLVIVDEAHACVGTHQSRQQRFELLRRLSADHDRHMLLLTATPHSGDEAAFDRLLGLLDENFGVGTLDEEAARVRLARHFVQRRRIDITGREWGEDRVFPRHDTKESPYRFYPEHNAFHDAVLNYCLGVVEGAGPDQHRRRLAFWGTLALMRCVGSSPAAAASALRNRLAAEPDRLAEQVFDDDADEADAIDVEPASGLNDADPLAALVTEAERLIAKPDPKLDATIKELKPLIAGGANPVVFCRFIATADHVAAVLRKVFPKLRIEAVTGALTPEERRARVEDMAGSDQRLLIATDCLSEGINLQSWFDTVIHYDMSWNPTRHQQREGRVDRYGQSAKLVRSILLYSSDSAIDGAVLEVILRKAELIRKATGVTVPLPDDRGAVTGALMNAVLLRKGRSRQLAFDFGHDVERMDTSWRNAEEGERRSRARFAQNALKPQEVAPEWQRWRDLLGGPDQVRRFVERGMSRLDAPIEPVSGNLVKVHLGELPMPVRERLAARGLDGTIRVSFEAPPAPHAETITRSHPLPAILAEVLFEGALDADVALTSSLGRVGAWPTSGVRSVTTILLLRLRFKLTVHARRERLLLVEEAGALAFSGSIGNVSATGAATLTLLDHPVAGELAPPARRRILNQARERVTTVFSAAITAYAQQRATELAQDHARVRSAGIGVARTSVEPVLPPDIIGLYVLLPQGA
jgi:superfamily II DNA or RNA helicase